MKDNKQKAFYSLLTIAAILICMASPLGYAEEEQEEDLYELSIEELMEVPIVVSGSRQEQKITATSVPITIVTSDDIHFQGATNIYEALAFVPGVDLFKTNRNVYSLGVHGLHDAFSDRTLTLINGRLADTLLFGGSEFLRQPIMMEDIERIEVVRGPGGAAWGANAFNGVINIITKKPEDCKGIFASTTWTEYGDSYSHLRYANTRGPASYRISLGYQDVKTSSDALGKKFLSNHPVDGGTYFDSRDFTRNFVFDGELYYQITDETLLSMGFGYSNIDQGDYPFLGDWSKTNGWLETIRSYVKLEHEFDESTSGFLQWTGNFANNKWPAISEAFSYENDIEGQLNLKLNKHNITIGGNIRLARIHQDQITNLDFIPGENPIKELNLGFFLIDNWELTERLTLEQQFRLDYFSETQIDWAGRIAALYALDDQKNHILRLAAAKAYRAPRISPRNSSVSRFNFPPFGTLANITSAPGISNEEVISLEAGYSGILSKSLMFNTNAFIQWYNGLIGYEQTATVLNPAPLVIRNDFLANNIGDAKSYGIETDLTYKTDYGIFSIWYSYNELIEQGVVRGNVDDDQHQSMRAFKPAKNKFGINSQFFLGDGWTFNANYKFNSFMSADFTEAPFDIPEHNRVDLSLAKEFSMNDETMTGEIMIGVSDVFNETEYKGTATGFFYDTHETPGRTVFARFQMNF